MGKTLADGRKAVITLDEIRLAFAEYAAVKLEIGYIGTESHTFDRGMRGKGFAEYDANDNVVRTFDGKEEAYAFYSRYAEVAREVLAAPLVTVQAPEDDQEASVMPEATSDTSKPTAPRQRAAKAVKSA